MTVANVQITQVLLKRGNTIRSEQYTGPRSELTHDTGTAGNGPHSIRIHDGQNPGGTLIASQGWVNESLANISFSGNGIPGGLTKQVQFNDGGNFAGHPNFTYDVNTDTLSVPGNIIVDNVYSVDSTVVHVHDDLETFGAFTAQGVYLKDGGSLVTLGNSIVSLNSSGNLVLEADGVSWTFGTDGNTIFPTGSQISSNYPGFTADGQSWFVTPSGNAGGVASADGQQYVQVNNGYGVEIGTAWPGNAHAWHFGLDGKTYFPAGYVLPNSIGAPGQTLILGGQGGVDWTDYVAVANAAPDSNAGLWYDITDGRLYTKVNDVWVDANPTVAPAPSFYLGNLEINGDTINFTNGTLTIDSTGNLLVNGSLVTGSGGGNYGNVDVAAYLPVYGGNVLAGNILSSTGALGLSANTAAPSLAWTLTTDVFGAGSSALIAPASDAQHQGEIVFPGASGMEFGALAWAGNIGTPFDNSMLMLAINGNVIIGTQGGIGGGNYWNFDTTGNLVLPTNTAAINYANGVSILSGIGGGSTYSNVDVAAYLVENPQAGMYANANVADYLANYDGVINFTASPAVITGLGNISSADFTFPNGVSILSTVTGTYSNTNVAAYLTSQSIAAQIQSDYTQADTGNVTYIKNKPDLSVYATTTALQTLNANVGAYETWANANVSSLQNQITGANTNIQTINANLGSYQTYANTNIQSINANLGGFETWANLNYLTSTTLGSTTTIVQTANVAYYPNVTATTTNATFYPGLYNAQSGNLATYTSANIQFNPSTGNLFIANAYLTTNATTATIFNNTPTTVNAFGAATKVNMGAALGNVNIAGNVVAAGNVHADGGYFKSSVATAYIVNSTPTTVYLAGGATIGTYIGNASGVTQLYGNVQGSTNGFAIGYRDIPQLSFTGNTTIALADAGKHYYSTQSTSFTLTVANNATQSFSIGTAINVINQGTGAITIAPAGGVSVYLAGNSTSGSRTLSSYGMATIQKVATDTWFLVGVGLS